MPSVDVDVDVCPGPSLTAMTVVGMSLITREGTGVVVSFSSSSHTLTQQDVETKSKVLFVF